jgi:uncharacterized protein with von Willebrand factor type A (vWA) domain
VTDLAALAVTLGDRLRRAGLPITPERSGRFARAVALVGPITVTELYWLARVTLVGRQEDVAAFDRIFGQVFGGWPEAVPRGLAASTPPVPVRPAAGGRRAPAAARVAPLGTPGSAGVGRTAGATPGDDDGRREVIGTVSREERLATTDFADLDEGELAELRALMQELRVSPPLRRGRRYRRQLRHGGRLDLRATLRRGRRSGGDPVVLLHRRQPPRPRRLVVLCDISGSMEPYARAYIQFLHATVGGSRAEVFTFATRLTRLSRALAVSQPELALARASSTAPDWRGGTRIGRALEEFLDRYGRRGLARGAVVVIVSDGWEGEDPALVGEQMARLHRLAHRIVWVNPRRAHPRYQPLAGGMAAALPHCDTVLSGHTLLALQEVVAAIARP